MPFSVDNYTNIKTGKIDHPDDVPCAHTMGRFRVRLARSAAEVQSCLDLRARVFFGHMADYTPPSEPRDDFAHHLVVIETDKQGGEAVVGNLRLFNSLYKPNNVRYYTEDYYDVSALHAAHDTKVELGRFCVDEGLRSGKILMLLWKAAIDYLRHYDLDLMFGISSFPGMDVAKHLPSMSLLRRERLLADNWMSPAIAIGAKSLHDLPEPSAEEAADIPTLMRGYMKMGARISDHYYEDPLYNTLFVMLAVEKKDFLTYLSEMDSRSKK